MAAKSKKEQEWIRKQVARFGLKVMCQMCHEEDRHYNEEGRLRDARCCHCGHKNLRPMWWLLKYKTKAIAERKKLQEAFPDLIR